jgi:hypothetical protein
MAGVSPSSFLVKLSSWTPSANLYVSQQTRNGTETCAVRVQRVRADERERHLGDDRAERREQQVRARDRGRGEHRQQLLAWEDIR